MREIIYIQAGNLANHIGTHFWNTEESYFDYATANQPQDDDRSLSYVDHDVSFREGRSYDGSPTYCPRLLIFDCRENFGSRARANDLYESNPSIRHKGLHVAGSLEEVVQQPIEPSPYQKALDDEFQETNEPGDPKTAETPQTVRYWSDYNRVYWSPRTMHPVYWGQSGAGSIRLVGRQMFDQLESESNITEDSLRLFVEECDLMQGFQVSFDTSTFGAFTTKLLECMYEEYPKTAILSSFNLSDVLLPAFGDLDTQEALKVIGDALILRDLSTTLSSLTIPLQSPSAWSLPMGGATFDLDTSNLYHTSALLSAHLECATLPFRARHDATDIYTFSNHLNPRGDTRIAQLSGFLPVPKYLEAVLDSFNFSGHGEALSKHPNSGGSRFSQRSVIRTDLPSDVPSISERVVADSALAGLHKSLLHLSSYPAYPTPSSYPRILQIRSGDTPRPKSMSLVSSLSTASTTAQTMASYATYVAEYTNRGGLSLEVWEGIGRDELRELREDLIKIGEAYSA